MATQRPAYRLRLYQRRSVDPTESTVLTPAAGAPHSEPFQVATIPGVTGYKPYLAIPKGRRSRVDFKSKKGDIGAMSVRILDQRVNALTGTDAERWFSAFWGDVDGKPALGTCRMEMDESLQGEDGPWTPFYTGRVDETKLQGTLEGALTFKDLMGDLERDVFTSDPLGVTYARRLPILPLSLTAPFGLLPAIAPPLPGRVKAVRTSQRYGFECGSRVNSSPEALGQQKIPRALADLASQDNRSPVYSRPERLLIFAPKTVRVRIVVAGVVSWWWLNSLRAEAKIEHDHLHWRPFLVAIFRADELNDAPASWPAEGTDLTWAFYYPNGPASEKNPILVDAADPVAFLADMMAGAFSPGSSVDGTPVAAARLDAASWSALTGVFPSMQFIVREKGILRTWAIEWVCQVLQLGLTMDARGRVVLLDLRRLETTSGLPELTDADVISSPDSEGFQQPVGDAITRIAAPVDIVAQLDGTDEFAKSSDEFPDRPPGMIRYQEVPNQYVAFGDIRAADYKDASWTVRLNGWPQFLPAGIPPANLYLEQAQRRSIQDQLIDAIFAVFARGPQYFTLVCRRSLTVEAVVVGTRIVVTTTKLPNTTTNTRGGSRIGLCIERSEDGPQVTLTFVDLQFITPADPPSFDVGGPIGDAAACTSLTVPVILNAGDQSVVVYWNAVPSVSDPRPADSDPGWIFGARTTVTGDVVLYGLPTGHRIYLRSRTEPTGSGAQQPPSAWVAPTPDHVDLCAITGPTGCALVANPSGGQLLTWTNTDPALSIRISVDGIVVEILPPGTTQWNPQGQTGTIAVDAVDATGGVALGCSVVIDPVGMTCPRPAGIQVLDPSAITIAGFPARSTDGTIFNWRLYRIGDDGTGCPIVDVEPTLLADNLPGTLSPIVYNDAQPTDGTIWWYAWSHVLPGWLESELTCWRSGIAAPGTPPAPSVILPTVTLTKTQDATTGTAHATIDDPECRATLAQWKHQAGTGAISDYAEAVGPDFTDTVALVADGVSTIWFRVTGYLADGSLGVLFEGTVTFGPDLQPPPEPGLLSVPIEIPLHAGAMVHLGLRTIPAAATTLTAWRGTEDKFDLGQFKSARLVATVLQTTVPELCTVAAQYEDPVTGVWDYLDGASGPWLIVGPTAVGTVPAVLSGDPAAIVDAARTDVRIRGVIVSGDAGAGTAILPRLVLQPRAEAANLPPPEEPPPPDEHPDPCLEARDPFEYADMAAMAAGGWTEADTMGAVSGWSTTAVNTTTGRGARLDVIGTTPSSQSSLQGKTFGGFNPGQSLVAKVDIYTVQTASGSGGGVVASDNFESYASSAAMLAVWLDGYGVWGYNPHLLTLNPTGGDGGGKCASISMTGGHGYSGGGGIYRNFTGLTPLAYYTATARAKKTAGTVIPKPLMKCGGSYSQVDGPTGSLVPLDGAWHTITATGRADASGNLQVQFGFYYSAQDPDPTWSALFDSFALASVDTGPTVPALQAGFGVSGGGSALLPANINIAGSTTLSLNVTANGSGSVPMQIGVFGSEAGSTYNRLFVFDDLRVCTSADVPSGGGGGPGGTDPVPPPAPAGGARPYGASAIPTTGAGIWNATIKFVNPSIVPSTIASARAHGIKLFLALAGTRSHFENPTFDWALYKSLIDAMAADSAANAAIVAGIADGTVFAHYVVDEPTAAGANGGQAISAADVERMCALSLSHWPTLPTAIRALPTAYPADIPSCSIYWAHYRLVRGDCAAYLARNTAKATEYGKKLVIGMNVLDFHGAGFTAANRPGSWATAADFEQYGTILASVGNPVAAFNIWEYEIGWYSQSGMAAAVQAVQTVFQSFDP